MTNQPTIQQLVKAAGYDYDRLPPHIQQDLTEDHGWTTIGPDESTRRIRSLLNQLNDEGQLDDHDDDHDDDLSEEINAVATAYTQIIADHVADAVTRTLFILGHDIARVAVNNATHAITLFPRGGDAIEIPPRP